MSLLLTSAPILMIPSSSKFRKLSSPILGISRVISSGPNFVSLASTSCFSIWTEVNLSSFINLLLNIIASSKLYPSQVMKPTSTFCPRASLPPSVDDPSASTSPFLTRMFTSTIGLWLIQVP